MNFFDLVNLEQVAFLDVVEAGQLDAALEAFADFLGIVLFAAQRIERVVADDRAVADDAGPAVPLDDAARARGSRRPCRRG